VSDRFVIGLDLGSSGVKAALVDPTKGILATATRPVDLESPHPGWAEADPEQWWSGVTAVIPQVLARAGHDVTEVAAVACSGMVPAVLCLDEHGVPRRPAILQNDARAVREISELREELAGVDLLGRTGSVLSQQSVAPTLRWLQRHEPELWQETRMVVGSYDWLTMRLGGEPAVERNWALESGLFDFGGHPLGEVHAAARLSTSMVPPVRSPGHRAGQVSAAASEETGLVTGTPIVVGGADHVLSAYGAGVANEGDWLIKLGGAGDVLAASGRAVVDARLYLDAHPAPGLWLPNGCMATSGSTARWLDGVLGGPGLDVLESEAVRSQAGALLCLPYFLGEKTPHHDPNLRGAFAGLHLGTSRSDLYRAVLESVAYGFRQHRDLLLGLGLPLEQPLVTNGGSRSTLWKQILADVLDAPLRPVVDHPGASLGAAAVAAVGAELVESWASVTHLVQLASPIEPQHNCAAIYRERYRLWLELQPALRPFSHQLAEGTPHA